MSTICLENSLVSNLKVIIYFYFIAAIIVFRPIVLFHFVMSKIISNNTRYNVNHLALVIKAFGLGVSDICYNDDNED